MRKGCHARVTWITANCSLCFILCYSLVRFTVPVGYSIYTDLYSYLYKWTHLPMGIYLSIQQFVFARMCSLCITCSLYKLVATVNTNVIASEDNGKIKSFLLQSLLYMYCHPKVFEHLVIFERMCREMLKIIYLFIEGSKMITYHNYTLDKYISRDIFEDEWYIFNFLYAYLRH